MNFFQSLSAALTPMGLVWTIIIIGIATFLHELAHYALARWQGVAVQSFSVGMGPVLFRKKWKDTEWRLSLLPIGGYVEIDGMAPATAADGTPIQATHGYAGLKPWGKIAILLAGPVMNLVVAIVLMTTMFSSQGMPAPDRAKIESVLDNSKAQQLGLQAGDVVTAIDGKTIPQTVTIDNKMAAGWELLRDTLTKVGPHTFSIERAGTTKEISFPWQPTIAGKRQLLGIRYGPDVQPASVPVAFSAALTTTAEALPQVLKSFGGLFQRFFTFDFSRDENVSGPIGTAEVVSRAAALSPWALVQVGILLNLSLAFFNLLPIPGLDGGRILLVLVGALRGRPLTFAQENAINFAGFAFVMLLTAFVVVRDVSRFF